MTRILACAVVFSIAATSSLEAQRVPDRKADEAAIRATLGKAVRAHQAGDAELWLQTVTDDAVLMLPGDSARRGIRNIGVAIRQFFATMISQPQVKIEDIQLDGDVAFVRTEARGTLAAKAGGPAMPVNMKELLVMRRQKDASWKAAYMALVPNAGPAVVQAGEPREVLHASAATAKYTASAGSPISSVTLFGDPDADAPNGQFITFPPNVDAGGWHTHSNTVTLVVLNGAYLYRDANGERRVGAGEFLRIPGGHRHWSGSDAQGGVFYLHLLARMDQTAAP